MVGWLAGWPAARRGFGLSLGQVNCGWPAIRVLRVCVLFRAGQWWLASHPASREFASSLGWVIVGWLAGWLAIPVSGWSSHGWPVGMSTLPGALTIK